LKELETDERARLEREFTEIVQVPAGLEDAEYALFSESETGIQGLPEEEEKVVESVEAAPMDEPEPPKKAEPKAVKASAGVETPEEIVNRLVNNPKAMALFKFKYNVRKRHSFSPRKKADKQPAAEV